MRRLTTVILPTIIFAVLLAWRVEGYGFDSGSGSNCGRPQQRTARLRDMPCDLSRQGYCTIAGSAYPWHAVRRFVRENQGLMRRMYGDQRHLAVLRAEMLTNDIDQTHYRYSNPEHEMFPDVETGAPKQPPRGRKDNGRLLNHENVLLNTKFIYSQEGNARPNDLPAMPHFRPASSTTTTTTTTAAPPQPSSGPLDNSIFEQLNSSLETNSVYTNITFYLIEEKNSYSNLTESDLTTEAAETTTSSPTTLLAAADAATTTTQPTTTNASTRKTAAISSTATTTTTTTTTKRAPQTTTSSPTSSTTTTTTSTETPSQLFQDVEQDKNGNFKLRGVNACPVKEEVVAPFWANNTRGEILALLNLYPFEQYVHWEKCLHEHRQMYCRDGCRCEQQYRLHRMLAYDPNNECRGIFSDWFRFPSCCVCKCYDLPAEFRVTSRSPRQDEGQT